MPTELEKKRNRSQSDIIADLLTAALDGKIKTHLMYSSNLSYTQLLDYLELLIEQNLLVYNKTNKIYKTTANGKKFLANYGRIECDSA